MNSTLTKRTANRVFALTATALLVLGASCADEPASVEPTTDRSASSAEPVETVAAPTASTPIGSSLTDEEIAGLMWMREEEQLAHDVYIALGDAWNLPIFDNISRAETTHLDAVAGLLDLAARAAATDTPEISAVYATLERACYNGPRRRAFYDEHRAAPTNSGGG